MTTLTLGITTPSTSHPDWDVAIWADGVDSVQFTVTYCDDAGNPITGAQLHFNKLNGNFTYDPVDLKTDAHGQVRGIGTSGAEGADTLQAYTDFPHIYFEYGPCQLRDRNPGK